MGGKPQKPIQAYSSNGLMSSRFTAPHKLNQSKDWKRYSPYSLARGESPVLEVNQDEVLRAELSSLSTKLRSWL